MADELEVAVPTELEEGKNTGVVVKVRSLDWYAAGETGIVYQSRLESGDWEKYKPSDEWQRRKVGSRLGYDTNSCVTFSGLNILEMQLNWMLDQELVPEATVRFLREEGYLDENGLANFSDWFAANTNGTTPEGNDLGTFWYNVKNTGILPQAGTPVPNDFTTIEDWFDKSKINDSMRLKAARFKYFFDIAYEWVVLDEQGAWDKFAKHVKHAPLHIATPTGKDWNKKNGIVPALPGVTRLNHATTYIGQSRKSYHKDLDHYDPFVKKLAWDYYIPYAVKGVLTLKKTDLPPLPFKYTFTTQLKYGDPKNSAEEVRKLQEALQYLGHMTKGVFGPFGPQTKKALGLFQTSVGITDPDGQGTNFGPLTRAALNNKLNG